MMSIEKSFIFVHIPKTAGCSISSALMEYSEDKKTNEGSSGFGIRNSAYPELFTHARLGDYAKYFMINDFITFTCVRNPWDRLLSWYFFNLRLVKRDNFNKHDFINFILSKDDPDTSPNNYSQYNFIQPGVDHIIRFENLQEDFNKVCSALGVDEMDLGIMNVSKNSKIDYHDYYDEESMSLIEDIYKDDIEHFGYKY